MTILTTNPNQTAAETFVTELAAAGLAAVCIAPGSRSTPLTLAFHRYPDVRVYLHLDERSAGFFALGMALATERPVALLCTSGTAAAEFFPAIVEANLSQVPLLILTADRPHELRHSGANQTADQVKLYGDQVLWAVDVALPTGDAPPIALRNLRTLGARAWAVANGVRKGPVHLNFPFRKPLEPHIPQTAPLTPVASPAVTIERGTIQPTADQVAELARLLVRHPRGLIVCGPRSPGGDFPAAVAELAAAAGYPILADPLSGVRFGPHVAGATVIGGYDGVLAGGGGRGAGGELRVARGEGRVARGEGRVARGEGRVARGRRPELAEGGRGVVLRFGAVPTSKHLNAYLDAAAPAHYTLVRADGVWADDSHRVNRFLQMDEAGLCRRVAGVLAVERSEKPGFFKKPGFFVTAEPIGWQATDDYLAAHFFDGAVVAETVKIMAASLPAGANLVMGNSLPVRHLDQFVRPNSFPLRVFGNRGASGIDGVTSTALGVAAGTGVPTVLITGDVSFIHDLNGLLAVNQHAINNITIVLINNRGGGIFRRLPIAQHDPPFTALFLTPHDLQFEHAARFYGMAHHLAADRATFTALLREALNASTPTLIEVPTDGVADLAHQRAVVKAVREALDRGSLDRGSATSHA